METGLLILVELLHYMIDLLIVLNKEQAKEPHIMKSVKKELVSHKPRLDSMIHLLVSIRESLLIFLIDQIEIEKEFMMALVP
jgi:hypothetical protein